MIHETLIFLKLLACLKLFQNNFLKEFTGDTSQFPVPHIRNLEVATPSLQEVKRLNRLKNQKLLLDP